MAFSIVEISILLVLLEDLVRVMTILCTFSIIGIAPRWIFISSRRITTNRVSVSLLVVNLFPLVIERDGHRNVEQPLGFSGDLFDNCVNIYSQFIVPFWERVFFCDVSWVMLQILP